MAKDSHVAAVVGTARKVGLPALLAPQRLRERDLVEAMMAARLLDPCSKLATARALPAETRESSLGESLDVAAADEDELYEAMDWLLTQQGRVGQALARQHLTAGGVVLYDVTSTYFEGRKCPLAKFGHPREGKRDKLQIVFELLTNGEGCPVAVEVFEGNVGIPKRCRPRSRSSASESGSRVVLVGDRGMITDARLPENFRPIEGLDWITAPRAPAIQAPGRRRHPAALALRPAGPRRDHAPRLPRRAAHRLPEPAWLRSGPASAGSGWRRPTRAGQDRRRHRAR